MCDRFAWRRTHLGLACRAGRVPNLFLMSRRVSGRFDRRMHRCIFRLGDRFADGVRNFFFVCGRVGCRFGWRMRGSLVSGASGLAAAMLGFVIMGRPMSRRLNAGMCEALVDSVVMEVF